jgi:hypothetical protein
MNRQVCYLPEPKYSNFKQLGITYTQHPKGDFEHPYTETSVSYVPLSCFSIDEHFDLAHQFNLLFA